MSRRSEAFDAIRARDTANTIDTMRRVGAFEPHTGNSVNCVYQGKDANAVVTASPQIAATEPEDTAGDAPCPVQERLPVIPLDVLVEQMAEAMIANPVYQITNPETAMAFFRANALTRLTATEDLLARELLLDWERHHVMLSAAFSPSMVNTIIRLIGIGDHDRLE